MIYIGGFYTDAVTVLLCNLRCTAMCIAIGENHIQIGCIKSI